MTPGPEPRRVRASTEGPARTVVVAGKRAVAEAIRAGVASEVLLADGATRTQGLREVRVRCGATTRLPGPSVSS